MKPKWFLALVIASVLSPGASASSDTELDRAAVDEQLANPVQTAYETLATDASKEQRARITDALAHGAYRWALTLTTDVVADQEAQAMWQTTRYERDPYAAFGEVLHQRINAVGGTIESTAQALAVAETAPLVPSNIETLMFAAHFVVQAESAMALAAATSSAAEAAPGANYDTSLKRHVVVYPLAAAIVQQEVAKQVLEDFTPTNGDRVVSASALRQLIESQGGAGQGWPVPEAGIMHRLARHLLIYERDLVLPDATRAHIQDGINQLVDESLRRLQDIGYSGARPTSAALEASWWLGQEPVDESNAAVQDMASRVNASVHLARYEAHLLSTAIPVSNEGGPPWIWIGAASAFFAMVVGGVAWIGRGRRLQGGTLPALAMTCVLLAGFAHIPHTQGAPSPADPVPAPTPLVETDAVTSGVSALIASDGLVHFSWGECTVAGKDCMTGRVLVRYRTYNPVSDVWSDPATLVDIPERNHFSPHLVEGAGLHLLWMQTDPTASDDVEVWWCRLEETSCTDAARLSAADANVGTEALAVTAGPGGRLRVAWSESSLDGHDIVFRQQSGSGWSQPVRFPDGSHDQRFPAVAVDREGMAYVAWLGQPPDASGSIYRVVEYATVDRQTNLPSGREYGSQHLSTNEGIDLLYTGGELHLTYGTEKGLFHRVLGNGDWSDAVNVSMTDRRVFRPNLASTPEGVAVLWMENVPPADGFRLRMSEYRDGLWLRPATVVDSPHRVHIWPSLHAEVSGTLHVTWTGDEPPDHKRRVYYMTVASDSQNADPPTIGRLLPVQDAWVRSDPVLLSAEVSLDAPLDGDATQWLLDGAPLAFEASGGRLVAEAASLAEGPHEARLLVRDESGNEVERVWGFGVDRTPPTLEVAVRDASGGLAQGWVAAPVQVTSRAEEDGGAPTYVEVQAIRRDGGKPVALGGAGKTWTQVDSNGLQLPEGVLLDVTVRGRDDAGNVVIAYEGTVGWDATPPELHFEVPAWSNATLRVPFENGSGATGGSPVHVEAVLTPSDASPASQTRGTGGDGRLGFKDLSEGEYQLTISVRDEAGNPQEPPPGPWIVNVDSTAPAMAVESSDRGLTLRAVDGGSGMALLEVRASGNTLLANRSAGGAVTLQINLTAAAGSLAWATDMVGNEILRLLRADGGLDEVDDPMDKTPDALDEADQDRDGGRLAPSAAPMAVLVALGMLAASRRRARP